TKPGADLRNFRDICAYVGGDPDGERFDISKYTQLSFHYFGFRKRTHRLSSSNSHLSESRSRGGESHRTTNDHADGIELLLTERRHLEWTPGRNDIHQPHPVASKATSDGLLRCRRDFFRRQ